MSYCSLEVFDRMPNAESNSSQSTALRCAAAVTADLADRCLVRTKTVMARRVIRPVSVVSERCWFSSQGIQSASSSSTVIRLDHLGYRGRR